MSNMRPGYTAGILALFSLILGGVILDFGFWTLDSGPSYASVRSADGSPNSNKVHGPKLPLDTPTSTPVCGVGWNIVPSLNTGTGFNYLTGVASASAEDIWAVGYYSPTHGDVRFTQTQHWDGAQWTQVRSPSEGVLNGVAVISSTDAWAVGYTGSGFGPFQTVTEHWDGTQWSIVPSPNPGASGGQLNGVTAISANDVWAVGFYVDGNGEITLTLHWDGTQWTEVISPNAAIKTELAGVSAVATNDVWAVGAYVSIAPTPHYLPVTLHWDGTQWSIVTVSASQTSYFFSVAAISANDVWAVGYVISAGVPRTLAEHWDGTQWSLTTTPSPSTVDNFLYGVSAVASNDVWATGTGSGSLAIHFDGTQWTRVTSQNADGGGDLLAVKALSSSDVWAVGDYLTYTSTYRTLTEHYADPCLTPTPGATSTPVVTVTPTAVPVAVGHVSWQGRPNPPSTLYVLPITMTLKSGVLEVNYPSQNTDNRGFFTVSVGGVPTGTYNWRVKSPKFLANSGVVTLTGAPTTNIEMGFVRTGDCNNDNLVNTLDFNILKITMGKSIGDPNYDDRADFTGDQTVNIVDFNLLKVNFGSAGAPPIGPRDSKNNQKQ